MRKLLLITSFLLFVFFTGCGTKQSPETGKSLDTAAETITDREDRQVVPPERIEKIISMAPSVTETLIHLGLGDKIIAVDAYSASIPGLPENIPVFDIMSPDSESIAALMPDIIFATAMSRVDGGDPYKPLADLGAFITHIPSSVDLAGIKEDIIFIGKITGTEEKAGEIINNMEKEIEAAIKESDNEKRGARVYFEVEGSPNIITFGKGTFLNEMLELVGAENIFSEQESWVSMSEEAVIERNPEIIFTNVGYLDDPVGEILNRNAWEAVDAVKNKRVYRIDDNSSSRPNEYITLALRQMASAIYAE